MPEKKFMSFDIEFKADDQDEGIIEGYTAFFDNSDSYNDIIEKGAFTKSIEGGIENVKFFFNHDWKSIPIGVVEELYEDDNGLKFKAKFNNTTQANDVKEAIKTGGINKMSIGYTTKKSKRKKVNGINYRYLEEVKLFEISAVNFPANEKADIQSFKNDDMEMKDFIKSEIKAGIEEIKAENSKGQIEFKNIDMTMSLGAQMKELVIEKESINKGYLYIGSTDIFATEFIYNSYGWENDSDWNNYYRQGYKMNGNTVELVGERTEVMPTTAFIDKKNANPSDEVKNELSEEENAEIEKELKSMLTKNIDENSILEALKK